MRRELLVEAKAPGTPQARLLELARRSSFLARAVLQNAAASGETLRSVLAQRGASSFGCLVAAHPNVPPSLLRELAVSVPGFVWKNPALSLLLLEDPSWFARVGAAAQDSLFAHPGAAPDWLVWAAESSLVVLQVAAARNPALSPACVEAMLTRGLADSSYMGERVLVALARRPGLSAAQQQRLLASGRAQVQNALSENPTLLQELAHLRRRPLLWFDQPLPSSREFAEGFWDEHIPPFLAEFDRVVPSAQDGASVGSSCSELLARVRALVLHPRVPAAALAPLLERQARLLRAVESSQFRADARLFPLDALYRRVASRAWLPLELERQLALHESAEIRLLCARRSSLWSESRALLTRDADARVRTAIARAPGLSSEELARLAQDASVWARVAVARRAGVPGEVLCALSLDPSPLVRSAASRNEALPVAWLRLLRRAGLDRSLESFSAPRLPLSPEERASLSAAGPLGEALACEDAAARAQAVARFFVVAPRETVAAATVPPRAEPREPSDEALFKQLELLANSPSPKVRQIAANHPQLPWSLREALAHDIHGKVRRAARLALRNQAPVAGESDAT